MVVGELLPLRLSPWLNCQCKIKEREQEEDRLRGSGRLDSCSFSIPGPMVEQADTTDLKSVAFGRASSILAGATMKYRMWLTYERRK